MSENADKNLQKGPQIKFFEQLARQNLQFHARVSEPDDNIIDIATNLKDIIFSTSDNVKIKSYNSKIYQFSDWIENNDQKSYQFTFSNKNTIYHLNIHMSLIKISFMNFIGNNINTTENVYRDLSNFEISYVTIIAKKVCEIFNNIQSINLELNHVSKRDEMNISKRNFDQKLTIKEIIFEIDSQKLPISFGVIESNMENKSKLDLGTERKLSLSDSIFSKSKLINLKIAFNINYKAENLINELKVGNTLIVDYKELNAVKAIIGNKKIFIGQIGQTDNKLSFKLEKFNRGDADKHALAAI